jgi:hypothetical protein
MQFALSDWVGTYVSISTTNDLPYWPPEADMPDAGEFPFYVAEGVTQDGYEALREEALPMICYVQGRESQLCLWVDPESGELYPVGAQTFPG